MTDRIEPAEPRPDLPLRGPHTFVIVPSWQLLWPLSNLDPQGCKHDVTGFGDELLAAGLPYPCERCGCLIIPSETYRREMARYDAGWGEHEREMARGDG